MANRLSATKKQHWCMARLVFSVRLHTQQLVHGYAGKDLTIQRRCALLQFTCRVWRSHTAPDPVQTSLEMLNLQPRHETAMVTVSESARKLLERAVVSPVQHSSGSGLS